MSNGKILICDDNEMIIHMTRFALESEGFEVETASDTGEIYDRIKSFRPDLILLDLNLPEEGGITVIGKLKSNKETEKTPVILCSGEDKLPEIARQVNAEGYIQKPFGVADLTEVIKKFVPKIK